MAATKMVTKGKSHILLKLLVLLLVVLAAYGAWLYLSAQKVRGLMTQAEHAYASMGESMEAKDYQQALATARDAADIAEQVNDELGGAQWEIATHIPVLGVEVQTARSLGSISTAFANEGAVPVLDAWEELMADGVIADGKFDIDHLSDKIDQVKQLMDALERADAVTEACAEELDCLPTSRFDEINEWKDRLESALASVDESLEGITEAINYINGFGELISGLMGGASQQPTA